jgi:uncharacterized protein (DUF697 family)
MNRAVLVHIVEKLEGFLGKLPASIQKPILHELTPLKQLFLQQRPPRLVLLGSSKAPLTEIFQALFGFTPVDYDRNSLIEIFRWQDLHAADHGTIAILDARGADAAAMANVHEELDQQSADVFLFVDEADSTKGPHKRELENLVALLKEDDSLAPSATVIGISFHDPQKKIGPEHNGKITRARSARKEARLKTALEGKGAVQSHLLQVIELPLSGSEQHNAKLDSGQRNFMSLLAKQLPNQARVEMLRISKDRAAQIEVAQVLVKSTTAVCAAIGAQPIPLADLPILTTLQLAMVAGIMHLSGRERNLRAATEFLGALGANVGLGMLLREGTRAVLKFFPGLGNVVAGTVAGAGTYAIGRATIAYFLEGVSIKDARRAYAMGRKKPARIGLLRSRNPDSARRR